MTKENKIQEFLELWKGNKGIGRMIIPSKFGRQLLVSKALELFLSKNSTSEVVIVSKNLSYKFQWGEWIQSNDLYKSCKSYNIDYILNNITKFPKFPFIIIDDLDNEKNIQDLLKIPHKFVLFISTSYDLNKFKSIPVVGTVSKDEAIENSWVGSYKEYKVLVDVDDLELYKDHDKKFYKYLKLFNYDLTLAMNCLASKESREELARLKNCDLKLINACTFGVHRELKWKKDFVYSHPKKELLARKILEYNTFNRVIIFSPTIEESLKYGDVQYNHKLTDKKKFEAIKNIKFPGAITLSAVNDISSDIESQFDTEIILCNNSSNILKENRLRLLKDGGRVFTFVIKGTMEEAWFKLSTLDNDYITITERMLQRVLEGKEIMEDRIEGPEMLFNY